MPATDPPRRITITTPFNFEHSRISVTHYSQPGEFLVPAKVASFAVARGYATEGWAGDSTTRTAKTGPRRRRSATSAAKSAKPAGHAGSHAGPDDAMGGTGVAAAHRAVAGQPVADSAE